MVWTKNTGTAYHQQDTDYYCGAATAQMILDSIGAGLLDQNVLYNSNSGHNTQPGWFTDPDGLKYTLNHYKPSNFNNIFVIYAKDTELEGSQKIVYTVRRYNVPTGTLVEGRGHWIVVRGVSTDVEPVPGTIYTINGFWINNPWPPSPSFYNPAVAPPPPHAGIDGCGGGGNRGIANEYVVYDTTWKDTYLTGWDVWGVGHKQFVSVCDPEVPKLGELTLKREEFWAKGDRLLTKEEAIKLASKGVDKHELLKDRVFADALRGARPADPILVQRLDLLDTFYYLIPMTIREHVTALLSIDGLYGNFRGGQVLVKPLKELFIDPEVIKSKILSEPIDLGKEFGKLIVREDIFCFYPIMVWRPCQESRSPYYPFYMITIGSRNIYIGYDGTVYPELHDIGLGG